MDVLSHHLPPINYGPETEAILFILPAKRPEEDRPARVKPSRPAQINEHSTNRDRNWICMFYVQRARRQAGRKGPDNLFANELFSQLNNFHNARDNINYSALVLL